MDLKEDFKISLDKKSTSKVTSEMCNERLLIFLSLSTLTNFQQNEAFMQK